MSSINPEHPKAGSEQRRILFGTYAVLFLIILMPISMMGIYAYRVSASSAEELLRSKHFTAAIVTRELVRREFEDRVRSLETLARSPSFIDAVRRGDEQATRDRLGVVVHSYPQLDRAFVADVEGTLWSDFPKAPESLGRSFAHRDWYHGFSESKQPYVSTVYRRHAAPQHLLVAITVPVEEPGTQEVLGVLVGQIRLDGLTELLRHVNVGSTGHVILLDHAGTVAAHPRLDLQEREFEEYRQIPLLKKEVLEVVHYHDPFTQEPTLATVVTSQVSGRDWTVVVQQPLAEAFEPMILLRWQIAGAGSFILLLLGVCMVALAKRHHKVRFLSQQQSRLNEELELENVERRRAETALQEINNELEKRVEERTRELHEKEKQLLQSQKMEAIGHLAGGVAHDFNNLLTVINGLSELLLSRMTPESEFRQDIEEISQAGERAADLTRQLLAFGRKQVLKPVVLDLNHVVKGMHNILSRIIGEHIDLETKLFPELRPVCVDPGQIEQVILNMAINARDAMPQGGKLTLETRNAQFREGTVAGAPEVVSGSYVMVGISDTGEGMDSETKARIFEPFFTTKDQGAGTGLGLAVAFGIVKQSGGTISVYSEPGRGSLFKIYLPAADSLPAVAETEAGSADPVRGSETILVVEDEEGVRKLVGRILGQAGYEVLLCATAGEARKHCREHQGQIDLLLTDVVMPEIGGLELARELCLLRKGMKVVYMSGYSESAVVRNGMLEPGTAFLEKPMTPATLCRKIRQVLDGTGV